MWTEAQKRIIEKTDSNFIVSAAAGSGKTTVLSQRVLEYIKNRNGSLDRLIIATFTRSASNDMKTKIASVLRDEGVKTGERRLIHESLKTASANISTIDSFAIRILKENFSKVNISPDFGIINQSEYAEIKKRVLKNQIEEYYATGKNNFEGFLRLFSENKRNSLEDVADELFSFIINIPFPAKWLDYQLGKYENVDKTVETCCAYLKVVFERFLEEYIAILNSEDMETTFYDFYETNDLSLIRNAINELNKEDWDGFVSFIKGICFVRAKPKTPKKITEFRNVLKEFFNDTDLFRITYDEIKHESEIILPQMKAYFDFVKDYYSRIETELRKIGRFDFSYISQLLLSILVEDYDFETGEYTPSSFASEFFENLDEVMIDEYQDVNDVQDLIFRAISDNGKKLFSVGDVKQSIYRFRGSNSNNFVKRTENTETITLGTNFRSDKGILDFVNYVFSGLFTRQIDGMKYDDNQKLYPPENAVSSGDSVEIHLTESNQDSLGYELHDYVSRLLRSDMQVYDKEAGKYRDIMPGDIAILVRSKMLGQKIEKCFNLYRNINIGTVQEISFWDSPEVNILIALLTIIDNPYDDLSLSAVLLSDLFGFDLDLLTNIRMTDLNISLYQCLCQYAENTKDGKALAACDFLDKYYLLSKSYMPDVLLLNIMNDFNYLDRKAFSAGSLVVRKQINLFYEYVCLKCNQPGMNLNSLVRSLNNGEDDSEKKKTDNESPETVKIMTIHDSKGLEFPVCIIPSLSSPIYLKGKGNSNKDAFGGFPYSPDEKRIYMDTQFGVSTLLRDENLLYEKETFQFCFQRFIERANNFDDELRILYVAMTRARNKLVLFLPDRQAKYDSDDLYDSLYNHSLPDSILLNKIYVKSLVTLEDYIYQRLVYSDDFKGFMREVRKLETYRGKLFSVSGAYGDKEDYTNEEKELAWYKEHDKSGELDYHITRDAERRDLETKKLLKTIGENIPSERKKIPAKIAVTELIKQLEGPDADAKQFNHELTIRKPQFEEEKILSGTQRGTAVHKFMRYADLFKDPEEELSRLRQDEYLTPEEADSIPLDRINDFKQSKLFEIIKSADRIWKEKELMTKLPADIYDKDAPEGSRIIVQGAIDILLESDGDMIIIDYKTDKVNDADELKERYSQQLRIYSDIVNNVYEKKVSKMYIWSFHLSEMIEI